ncbi:MAG: hypothetical protein D6814_13615 [Calditrichaeota bacterium]|nr:MAG: hypothetical protein D6814_13615 [Calditrichota bacterium]
MLNCHAKYQSPAGANPDRAFFSTLIRRKSFKCAAFSFYFPEHKILNSISFNKVRKYTETSPNA